MAAQAGPPRFRNSHVLDAAGFTEFLTGRGLAPKTIRLYVLAVQRAATAVGPLEAVTAVAVGSYADTLVAGYSTRRHLRTGLMLFWEWRAVEGPWRAVRIPPKPRGRCRALTETDAAAMVKASLGWYPQGLAVLFGFYLALRTSETAAAEMGRFDREMAWYTVTGKRQVTATLPVHPVLAAEVRDARVAGWVFPGGNGRNHVTHATIWNWVREVARTAGVEEGVWPHRLRHTALATANDNTGDLRSVADFARHADVGVTMLYTRTTETNLRRVAGSLNYLG